jgi:hypothetical protein
MRGFSPRSADRGGTQALSFDRWALIVFEDIAQLFFQLAFGDYVFDSAPSSLATFAHRRRFGAPFGTLQHGIELLRFFGFPEKLIVNVKMFVFAFAHCSRKAPEINRIDQPRCVKLRTIADSARHSTVPIIFGGRTKKVQLPRSADWKIGLSKIIKNNDLSNTPYAITVF